MHKTFSTRNRGPVPSLNLTSTGNQLGVLNKNRLTETTTSSSSSIHKTDPPAKRKIFNASKIKNKFYRVAKQSCETGEQDVLAMKRFYDSCQTNQIAANPIFSKIQNGVCSIIGYYISKEQAHAIGQLIASLKDSKELFFEEIIFDYNGMKDEQFAAILSALHKVKALKKITYVNNEMGQKSVLELNALLKGDNGHVI